MTANALYEQFCTIYQKAGKLEANEWFSKLPYQSKKLLRAELEKNDLDYLLEE